ncbi:hypothetical protein GALMADRAFT_236616 [Galerina marginata CBS 339.88]|uniref:Uncharacterized protein n=1 Tax=Galerina marginata (strain CBS 339.88) TaxID=685588 RepID=A0A067TLL1_GALM3|nr:hypothetical protein GALMADRAFT_236616 [Galerina marginata CBS 339.88]
MARQFWLGPYTVNSVINKLALQTSCKWAKWYPGVSYVREPRGRKDDHARHHRHHVNYRPYR